MAKKDYYTSPDNYTDIDGNLKTFTYVDHDIKTKISTSIPETIEEKEKRIKEQKSILEETILEILEFPAIYSAYPEDDMLQAHLFNEIINSTNGITWDETILREVCRLNREFAYTLRRRLWKQYIKPEHIFKDIT